MKEKGGYEYIMFSCNATTFAIIEFEEKLYIFKKGFRHGSTLKFYFNNLIGKFIPHHLPKWQVKLFLVD